MAGSPSRQSRADRRDHVITATLDVIADQGVAGVTYRSVAAAAGVPFGSMTYYFASKDELLHAAFERFTHESFAHMDTATDVDEADLVDRLTSLVLAEADARPRDRLLLAEMYVLSYRDERYAQLTRAWMRRARAAIARTVGDRRARALDVAQEGLTLQRHFLPDELDEDLIRDTLNAVHVGVRDTSTLDGPR
ncbi:TetR/AcrR family transcriptional regulator [Cellulomonas triticagri]|uniref:TetR/AcrR family transcriptional regulator n=1 Tax=Cellulomonas triticagri TaxID=2483352 RepID=UPI0013152177|nr:TetR family transcriptional regulator [Cellulomonas triticagri]